MAYQSIIAEIVYSNGRRRVRPVEGQPYPSTMFVECSRKMRQNHPVGTKLRIMVKETDKEGGNEFLYSHYNWNYDVVR